MTSSDEPDASNITLPLGRHRHPHRPSYPPQPSSLVVLLSPGRQRLITGGDIRLLNDFAVHYWRNNIRVSSRSNLPQSSISAILHVLRPTGPNSITVPMRVHIYVHKRSASL